MLSEASLLGGLIGLVVSTALLAWQTRAVAQQTKISNAIAGSTALRDTADSLRDVYMVFIDRPELRAYFYDNRPCPRRGKLRAIVITTAEMLADILESGLLSTRLLPSSESLDDLINYSRYMLAHSPALTEIVQQHPQWWPNLTRLL